MNDCKETPGSCPAFDNTLKLYNKGRAYDAPVDASHARSFIPPGTAETRDFSGVGIEIPEFISSNCTGCMECVTLCPDSAIMGKAIKESRVNEEVKNNNGRFKEMFSKTKKYYDLQKKRGKEGAMFGIFIDPYKCKGCGECVKVCDDRGTSALKMVTKTGKKLAYYKDALAFFKMLGPTNDEYIVEKSLHDMMLKDNTWLYTGGAGSCAGCGEATAIRMMLAATSYFHGPNSCGIVAATGCNTVYGSTYPYNVYRVPWTNSLFENAPAVAMGLRKAWDMKGLNDKKIWVLGGDGAMNDIGFQSLSRMIASGLDINVLVLDTQVYSNTGGQSSGSTYFSQVTKFSQYGKQLHGKLEKRKELAMICMMHPHVYVSQTTTNNINHFYKSIIRANEYKGPAVINVYTSCQPEHGIGEDMSAHQARLAVYSRAFPLFIYDPCKGDSYKQRISLWGNPAIDKDWYVNPKTGEIIDFITFARTEGRFSRHFDKEGNPSRELRIANDNRLKNWRKLQDLAGVI